MDNNKYLLIGLGGAGGNHLKMPHYAYYDCLAIGRDKQVLDGIPASYKICIEPDDTNDWSSAFDIQKPKLDDMLIGKTTVIVIAGVGGRTTTGLLPLLGEHVSKKGVRLIGVVNQPFDFEGLNRSRSADACLEKSQPFFQKLEILRLQDLFSWANEQTTFAEAFAEVDERIYAYVKSIRPEVSPFNVLRHQYVQ